MRPTSIAVLLAASVAATGCATLEPRECKFDADLIKQDANACAANPKALPGCVIGVKVSATCPF